MTTKNYSAPPGTCSVPGCTNPRHVSKYGRTYPRCTEHYRSDYRKSATQRGAALPTKSRRKPAPDVDTVPVMVIDWKTEQVFHVTGFVVGEPEPFPRTDGEMKKIIAQASQKGIYVAYTRAYKEEDLYEST